MCEEDEAGSFTDDTKFSNDIDEILLMTEFTREELKFIYNDFKAVGLCGWFRCFEFENDLKLFGLKKCPTGFLTEETLSCIYAALFPLGNCKRYAKHLYSTMMRNPRANHVTFKDFAVSLSAITKGTIEQRVKWLFSFYDLNKDGKITRDVGIV
jgi:hypothetical protein